MKYCLVTQRLEKVLPDVPGPEDEVSGKVRFTPSISYGGSFQVETEDGVATVPAAPVEAEIVAGVLTHGGEPGVRLFAGGENSNPRKVVWTAIYQDMSVGGHRTHLEKVTFMAVPDGVVDLTTVTPVSGSTPPGVTKGDQGDPGKDGQDGLTPRIEGGTWWIGNTNTGVPSRGPQGDDGATPEIVDGTWWIDGSDTGVPATGTQGRPGTDGDDGSDGLTPRIVDGMWWVGETNTGVPTTGEKGDTGEAPPRSSRLLLHTGTGEPVLEDFPDTQVGDLIERVSDGQRWKVEAS